MSRTPMWLASVSLVLLVGLYPRTAAADGMAFRTVGASAEVRATAQRAVMWLRGGTWEIHVQPVFGRETGSAAWVVPFPVQPEVHESSAGFFDQLELVTSPVFMTTCWESSSGMGCFPFAADKGGGNGDSMQQGTIAVVVWEQGEVGDLDYVILSAIDGTSLVDWLGAEGYEIPSGADTLIADLDTEGVYFFAARLGADADPEKPLAPVRFVLPGMDPPSYPLRLTGLGATEEEPLELTIWIILPESRGFVPDSHPYGRLSNTPRDIEEFDAALDDFFAGGSPSSLVVLSSLNWELWDIINNHQFCAMGYSCASFERLGIDPPETWEDEMMEIESQMDLIYRYQGRLYGPGLASDLVLEEVDLSDRPSAHNVYEHSEGECRESGACSVSGDGGASLTLLLAALAAVAILVWVRRRRS